jgi:hypothetical protein
MANRLESVVGAIQGDPLAPQHEEAALDACSDAQLEALAAGAQEVWQGMDQFQVLEKLKSMRRSVETARQMGLPPRLQKLDALRARVLLLRRQAARQVRAARGGAWGWARGGAGRGGAGRGGVGRRFAAAAGGPHGGASGVGARRPCAMRAAAPMRRGMLPRLPGSLAPCPHVRAATPKPLPRPKQHAARRTRRSSRRRTRSGRRVAAPWGRRGSPPRGRARAPSCRSHRAAWAAPQARGCLCSGRRPRASGSWPGGCRTLATSTPRPVSPV